VKQERRRDDVFMDADGTALDAPIRDLAASDGGHDELLINGRQIHIAPAQLADLDRLRSFYQHLSDTSTYFRFFGIRRSIPERELREALDPEVDRHVTLLATIDGELVGIGEFIVAPSDDEAEVAFAVSDDHQGEGVATLLLENLVAIARRRNLSVLTAVVLPDNAQMLLVFRTVGLSEQARLDDDCVVEVRFDLRAPDELQKRSDERRLNAMRHARVQSG
jgi:GNAT superfamily N-acetyltransferase